MLAHFKAINDLMKIALVRHQNSDLCDFGLSDNEDADLKEYLEGKNCMVDCPDWKDRSIHWEKFDLIIIKSTWDYHRNITQFYAWLNRLECLNLCVLNPIETLRWNSNKRYLSAIGEAGLPVISSVFLKKGEEPDLSELFLKLESTQLIIKPCVGASAKDTMRVMIDKFVKQQDELKELLKTGEFVVQPFINEIFEGEWSLIFFNGIYSHGVLKRPDKNDFRVQQQYGGTFQSQIPKDSYVQVARKYVRLFASDTLYARVDGVIVNDEFVLMELELIEPYLFLNSDIRSYDAYYNALLSTVKKLNKRVVERY